MHLQRRVLADERAGGPGVVEVDVGEEEMADLAELEPSLGEARLQRRHARRRAAVEERRAVVGLDDVAADVPLAPRCRRSIGAGTVIGVNVSDVGEDDDADRDDERRGGP